jgi:hypothetical protein
VLTERVSGQADQSYHAQSDKNIPSFAPVKVKIIATRGPDWPKK